MSKSCLDVKLNMKPVLCLFSHKYYYEGPCRMTGGDALQPGFDDVLNAKIVKGVMADLRQLPRRCLHAARARRSHRDRRLGHRRRLPREAHGG